MSDQVVTIKCKTHQREREHDYARDEGRENRVTETRRPTRRPTRHMRRDNRRDARRKCNSFENERLAYRASVSRRVGMLCQWSNSVFEIATRRRARKRVGGFYA